MARSQLSFGVRLLRPSGREGADEPVSKPLERQLRDARGNRPSLRQAARPGASFGLTAGILFVLRIALAVLGTWR